QARVALGAALECAQVRAEVGRVEHVRGYDLELPRARPPPEHLVVADGQRRLAVGRLRDVVDLVPGRVRAHPRERVVKQPERRAVRGSARCAARLLLRVPLAVVTTTPRGEGD